MRSVLFASLSPTKGSISAFGFTEGFVGIPGDEVVLAAGVEVEGIVAGARQEAVIVDEGFIDGQELQGTFEVEHGLEGFSQVFGSSFLLISQDFWYAAGSSPR